MLYRDLKYLFTDKSLTTCINPLDINGRWKPEGKIFSLLGSALLSHFYFHLCNVIMTFNKHISAQSYHHFDFWCCQECDSMRWPITESRAQKESLDKYPNFSSFAYLLITLCH